MRREARTQALPGSQSIEADVPARRGRLRWSNLHSMGIAGLGTDWILDSRFRRALRAVIAAGGVKPLPRRQLAPVEIPEEGA